MLALAAALVAQPSRRLTIQNLAPTAREEWFAVPVPFARGAVPDLPDLHVEGRDTVWQPFGARWPDGSLRQALCLFRADLPAHGEASLALVEGKAPHAGEGDEGDAEAGAAGAPEGRAPEGRSAEPGAQRDEGAPQVGAPGLGEAAADAARTGAPSATAPPAGAPQGAAPPAGAPRAVAVQPDQAQPEQAQPKQAQPGQAQPDAAPPDATRGEGAAADAPEPEAAELGVDMEAEVLWGGRAWRGQPQRAAVLEVNAARRVELWRCRMGDSGLLLEVLVTRYARQEHMPACVALWFSDPTTKAMQVEVERVALTCRGMALLLRHPNLFGLRTELTATGSRTVLLADAVLGDGQGIRRAGVLAPALRGDHSLRDQTILAAAVAPPLGATPWGDSGAFGPFGYVPEPPPWLPPRVLPAQFAARHARFVRASAAARGDPFANLPFGLAKYAGQTGAQEDFGVVKLEPVAATGIPSFLLEVEPSVLQEACRPVHFFEADGEPVQSAAHPKWVVWAGRTHWHCGVSVDRLGKPCPAGRFETHGWTGKDRQHWSSLYLSAFYLLTGEEWARREIQNEVQLYLAGQTTAPHLSTSGAGAPRGAGRTLLTACWLYQCTGDAALLARMRERIELVHARQWAGAELPAQAVRPFAVSEPDDRMLRGKCRFWTPWQDALAVVGFAAAHRTTGSAAAGRLADELALNLLRHGWRFAGGEPPTIAAALKWKPDGEPLTAAERASNDPEVVQWTPGIGFATWAIGSVVVGKQAAQRLGDAELVERADRILTYVRAQRRPPRDGWFDNFGSWDAVR